jgi:transcription elongation factor GreA
MKTIKAELVPSILTAGEWTKWNTEARKILKTNPDFGTLPDKRDQFEVRDMPISFEEKIFNKFKAEKSFFNRVQYVQDFMAEAEPDSDYFKDMFSYFTGFLKSPGTASELMVSSFLLVQRIINIYPFLNPGLDFDFGDVLDQTEDVPGVFARIEDPELKKDFLLSIKRQSVEWPALYAKLFRYYLSRFIIDELADAEKIDIIKEMVADIIRHYRDEREAFIWLARNTLDEEWFSQLDTTFEKILICLIHLLDITFRDISNRRDVGVNRKLNRQIQDFLFKEDKLQEYLQTADEESVNRIYTLVEDVKELDPSLKVDVKQTIRTRFPDFHFHGEDEKETVSRGLLVTRGGYGEKQKQLRHILEVEIPLNSKDIGKAMEKGDLRENAEYKAALEKQDLLNSTAAKIQAQLSEAQVFDESDVDTGSISFGTKVLLINLDNQESEEYIILGPWESDPAKKIISYLSPIGAHLYAHEKGDEVEFSLNDNSFHYKVKDIEKAPAGMI